MAEVVLGIGSSRSPMTALPPEMWPALGERDKLSTRIKDRFGVPTNYEELLAKAPASVADHLTPEVMRAEVTTPSSATCRRWWTPSPRRGPTSSS